MMICHVDMDSFFVSVERLLNPRLNGKPVAVGGSVEGRGVVSSASYEARVYGVRSAMPMAQALRLCPNLIIVKHNSAGYGKYSSHVQDIFLEYSPLVQMASLDEAYIDLRGTERLHGSPLKAVHALRNHVMRETNLPCSIGLASNKLVAKIASALCKPKGLLWVPEGSEQAFLAPLPIKKLPGVGGKTCERLEDLGFKTIGQLARAPENLLTRHFQSFGPTLAAMARGQSNSEVLPCNPPKSIGSEETFSQDSASLDWLDGVLSRLSEKVAGRLRAKGATCGVITVKYRYAGFETHTAAQTLSVPTMNEVDIHRIARDLLLQKWNRQPLRLLGVSASQLFFGAAPADLFAEATAERDNALLTAIDKSRGKHGFTAIQRGSSLPPRKRGEEKEE